MADTHPVSRAEQVPQDLHVHTTFSSGDGAIEAEQTVELVADTAHAKILGISDHIEHVSGLAYDDYRATVRRHGLHLGVEVNGCRWVERALSLDVEYFIYHCYDRAEDYRGAEALLATRKPVIIAHPLTLGTNLDKVPDECLIEVNNRYVWRNDWNAQLRDYVSRFRWVIGSDAHQPHWLNQNVARAVAAKLGIQETILFSA